MRRVLELEDLLDSEPHRSEAFGQFLEGLRELTQADHAFAIGYEVGPGALRLTEPVTARFDGPRMQREFNAFLATQPPVGWSRYNPLRPEPEQRNVVIGWDDLVRLYGTDWSPGRERVYPKLGMEKDDQIRVLVCDGAEALSFVGLLRDTPFEPREKSLLRRLTSALGRHLRFRRDFQLQGLAAPALSVVLEAIGAPALVLRNKKVVLANAAAKDWLTSDFDDVTRAIESGSSIRGAVERSPFGAPGLPPHELLVVRALHGAADARLTEATHRWTLTPRQAEVLALVAEGRSNRSISAVLQISERTLEVHITALLDKADCQSRAELIARVWSGR